MQIIDTGLARFANEMKVFRGNFYIFRLRVSCAASKPHVFSPLSSYHILSCSLVFSFFLGFLGCLGRLGRLGHLDCLGCLGCLGKNLKYLSFIAQPMRLKDFSVLFEL